MTRKKVRASTCEFDGVDLKLGDLWNSIEERRRDPLNGKKLSRESVSSVAGRSRSCYRIRLEHHGGLRLSGARPVRYDMGGWRNVARRDFCGGAG